MRVLAFILLLTYLTGCIPVFIGAAAGTAGLVASQERTVGEAVDDNVIFWKIKNSYLQLNAQDLIAGVNIEVINGRVHLTGKVDNPETRVDAVRLAWQPSGVVEVINEIQIEPRDEKKLKNIAKDIYLANAVRSRLILEKGLRSSNYSIDCINSVVYLMGIAQNEEELEKALVIARTIRGVERVVSHVLIKDKPEDL